MRVRISPSPLYPFDLNIIKERDRSKDTSYKNFNVWLIRFLFTLYPLFFYLCSVGREVMQRPAKAFSLEHYQGGTPYVRGVMVA